MLVQAAERPLRLRWGGQAPRALRFLYTFETGSISMYMTCLGVCEGCCVPERSETPEPWRTTSARASASLLASERRCTVRSCAGFQAPLTHMKTRIDICARVWGPTSEENTMVLTEAQLPWWENTGWPPASLCRSSGQIPLPQDDESIEELILSNSSELQAKGNEGPPSGGSSNFRDVRASAGELKQTIQAGTVQ